MQIPYLCSDQAKHLVFLLIRFPQAIKINQVGVFYFHQWLPALPSSPYFKPPDARRQVGVLAVLGRVGFSGATQSCGCLEVQMSCCEIRNEFPRSNSRGRAVQAQEEKRISRFL
ncbi:uncharacterized protein LOC125216203 [Salvia hispanica]|uniref:uncharacterized protein LOC125216203 n=1 Tax=Salvia hispanica TaxID=49212 RepID=UPI0020096DFD|nr:uncharacterized protein LOC125216203 [Salvia hispanica]